MSRDSASVPQLVPDTEEPEPEMLTSVSFTQLVLKNAELYLFVLLELIRQTAYSLVPLCLRPTKNVDNQIALITGGGSGFGRLMALRFAKLGCKIVVWDLNETNAKETCRLVKNQNGSAVCYKVDVSNRTQVYEVAKLVKTEVGRVDILVNNAGVATANFFLDTPDAQLENLMKVNAMSHFWTVKAFLRDMMEVNQGHIVCVASIASYTGLPKAASYSASKHALLGFMDALSLELLHEGYDGVKTTVVCPYFSNTGFCDVKLSDIFPMIPPEQIVDDIMEGFLAEKEIIYTPKRVVAARLVNPILSNKFKCWVQKFLSGEEAISSAKACTKPSLNFHTD